MEQREYVTSVYMSVQDKELRFVTWYAFLYKRFLCGIITTSLCTNSKEPFAAVSWGAYSCNVEDSHIPITFEILFLPYNEVCLLNFYWDNWYTKYRRNGTINIS